MQSRRFSFFDIALMSVSTVGLVVCSIALINENWIIRRFAQGDVQLQKIGSIQAAKNDVRRRMNQSLTFYSASKAEDLYEKDNVFTGPDSEVTLQIGKTQDITVGANSLVVLRTNKDQIALDLQLGTISTTTSPKQKLQIMHQGEITEISSKSGSGPILISKNESGMVEIGSQTDDVEVKVGKNISQILKNESLTIDNKKEVKKSNRPVRIANKPIFEKIINPSDAQLNLKLESTEPNRTLKFELSSQESFKKIEHSQPIDSLEPNIILPNKQGTFYYRLVDAQTGEPLTAIHRFERILAMAPNLNLPENAKILRLQPQNTSHPVQFDWEKVGTEMNYNLEIARSEDFSGPVRTESIAANRLLLSLDEGSYHWRVRAAGESFVGHWSEVRKFSVLSNTAVLPVSEAVADTASTPVAEADPSSLETAQTMLALKTLIGPPPFVGPEKPVEPLELPQKMIAQEDAQAPVPTSLKQKIILEFSSGVNARDPASVEKSVQNPPQLKWKHAKEKSNYTLEIAKDKNFEGAEKIPVSGKKSFEFRSAKPGTYYWRVFESGGNALPPSEVASLEVKLPKPQVQGADPVEKKTTNVQDLKKPHEFALKWDEIPFAAGYKVGVDAKAEIIQGSTYKVSVQSGKKVQLKVAAVNAQNQTIGEVAERDLAYKMELELKSPNPLLPADKTTIVVFDSATLDPVLFSWSEINGATYEIEFSSSKDFATTLKTIPSKMNKFVLNELLAKGPIYWRVRAKAGTATSQWSPSRMFER